MTRHNADPFVGLPNTQRNYQAAGTRRITSIRRRFIHRKSYNSMMVHGLVVGYVKTKYEVSRNGGLPTRWLEPARWGDPRKEDPPEDFWRTLVADRGPNGENPPPYYRRACKECFVTDPSRNPRHDGNPLNTQKLIDEGRCSTIAEFLRRVQAVIWNRCLMHTGSDQLGLLPEKAVEGDLICILFGCSVPLILRKREKSAEQLVKEHEEDEKANMIEAAQLIWRAWKRRKGERQSMKEIRKKLFPNGLKEKVQPLPPASNKGIFSRETCIDIKVWALRKSDKLQFHISFLLTATRLAWYLWILWRIGLFQSDFQGGAVVILGLFQAFRILYSKDFYDDQGSNIFLKGIRKISPSLTPRSKAILNMFVWAIVLQRQLNTSDSSTPSVGSFIASIILLSPYLPWLYWTCVRKVHSWLEGLLDQATPAPLPETDTHRYYYQVIGECYVHGMMNGEGLEIQNEMEIKRTVFELR